VDEILDQMLSELGPLPGYEAIGSIPAIFQQLFLPKLKVALKNRGLQNQLKGTLRDCYNTAPCQNYLKKGMSFRNFIRTVYPVITNVNDFLSQRPGTFSQTSFST